MSKFPVVPFPDLEPLQNQFVDRHGDHWSVARLIDDTKNLKPFDCPLAALDLSDVVWVGANIQTLAQHCKKVEEADLSYPIILSWCGSIADGRHRVIRALVDGKSTIKAVRMTWRPEPCKEAPNAE